MEFDKTIWHDAHTDFPKPGESVIILKMDRKNGKIQKGTFSISIGSMMASHTDDGGPADKNAGWNQNDVVLWARLGLPQGTGSPVLEMEISELQHTIDIMQKLMFCYAGRTLDNIIQNIRMILDFKIKKYNLTKDQ